MTAVDVRQDPRNQRPHDQPVLYWSERRGSWWPGVGRRCPECRGTLYATPPYAETRIGFTPGRISCLMCERAWADVLDRRPPVLTAADLAPEPRGRPPGPVRERRRTPLTDPSERPCRDCTERIAVINRARCRVCSKANRDAARAGRQFRRVMQPGVPMETVVLQRIFGYTKGSLTSAITRARANGVPLTTTRRGWLTLEVEP